MNKGWVTKIVFWLAILVSSAWLLLATALAVAMFRRSIANGLTLSWYGAIEILILSAFALQPIINAFLIIRAIRLRHVGTPFQIMARGLYPLLSAAVLLYIVKIMIYLDDQSEMRRIRLWRTGSITYLCSTVSLAADYHANTIGKIELKLYELRHSQELSTWIVARPGKKPITATSFPAKTGSYGGSQGIKWQEPDGRLMIAYLSFSDLMSKYGPGTIWVALTEGGTPRRDLNPDEINSKKFTCGPDPSSYREQ